MEEKKIWKKDEIKELLQTNDRAVLRGLVAVYSLQTKDEKALAETVEHNGVGFSGFDAEILTSFAKQVQEQGKLTDRQMEVARKRVLKYAGQLKIRKILQLPRRLMRRGG